MRTIIRLARITHELVDRTADSRRAGTAHELVDRIVEQARWLEQIRYVRSESSGERVATGSTGTPTENLGGLTGCGCQDDDPDAEHRCLPGRAGQALDVGRDAFVHVIRHMAAAAFSGDTDGAPSHVVKHLAATQKRMAGLVGDGWGQGMGANWDAPMVRTPQEIKEAREAKRRRERAGAGYGDESLLYAVRETR